MAQKRRRRKKEALMGRLIISLGLASKIIQIIGAAFSVSALSGTRMTVVTACLMVGGLAVLASERLNTVSAFALIALVGVVGGLLPSRSAVYSFIFMAVSFIAYGAMLIAMKRPWRAAAAVTVFLATAVLALSVFGAFTIPSAAITACLIIAYGAMALGLYI